VTVGEHLDARAIETLFSGIKAVLRERWEITHATLEPEVTGCGENALLGQWEREESSRE